MKLRLAIFGFLICWFSGILQAQERYWVVFRDKKDVDFDPYAYFDGKTIEKRIRQGIPLVQYTDIPVKEEYCDRIEDFSPVTMKSRWLNAVAAELSGSQKKEVEKLDFVSELIRMELTASLSTRLDFSKDSLRFLHLRRQTAVMGGDFFKKEGIDGKGVRIAVFDGGFPEVDTLDMFRHLFDDKRIIATYDFVNENEHVYDFNSHGTSVLACIAGYIDGDNYGLATGAEFLLARTEVNSEIFAEEEYWAAAMEWADKNGADIISSSLGYTYHRYFPKQMDGKTVFVTRMANIAARKGILVVNAAGNDGDSDWQVISAPADADSVLTVGGISSFSGTHIGFSSFGPTYDGRLKPNVVAFGDVITTGKKELKTSYGTSFSTPLVSGFAACVMQMNPDWNNMKVFDEIQKSGHLYPYHDYAHGYGVPQASYFFGLKPELNPSFTFDRKINFLEIEVNKVITDNESAQSFQPDENNVFFGMDASYLYFHIASGKNGKIRKYKVIKMTDADRYSISLDEIREGEYLMAYYKGYSEIFKP
jgi:hypothetical protein